MVLLEKADHNTKITELENNIPDISNLAKKTALTTIENKIPNVRNSIKNTVIILKLLQLKINLLTKIMKNILILKSLIN